MGMLARFGANICAKRPGALMPSSSPRWVITLRDAIKREHGLGWSVREMSGRIQLTRRFDDGTRSSVTLDLPWSPASTTSALSQIKELRERMESAGLSIKEAQQLVSSPVARAEGRIDWELVMQRFEKYKVLDSGDVRPSTFERLYRPVLNQVREVVRTRPIPRDGRSVLAGLRDTYGGAPGSPGRRLRIMYAAQLLRYAVGQMGAPARWGPPDDLVPLIGRRDAAQKNPATPLKDDQLARLLEGIPDPRWRFAVQLMATFGLRPVELRYLRVSGQKLRVDYQKRTSRGMTKPRELSGLDPLGMPGLAQHLIGRLAIGDALPPLGNNDATTATALATYLKRRPPWNSLRQEIAATGGKLSVYSCRHGFALRAAQLYGLSPRVTAALMGHSLQTHVNHYGHWTDADTLDEAVAAAIQRTQALHARAMA